MTSKNQLPELPYSQWIETRITLHLILQLIGKIRLDRTPRKNHWWFITQYISVHGFTTSHIPCQDGLNTFEIVYDVHKGEVRIQTSFSETRTIPLIDGLTIAQFYERFMEALAGLGIQADIVDKPFDLGIDKRFQEITEYHHYDLEYIQRFWKILLWVDGVFNEFSGRFYGKTCPVQLYWHHMDLAITRFSGKKAPPLNTSSRLSDKDAYSHEVISFGFWAGDETVKEPAFYSYTYPSPNNLDQEPLKPDVAQWVDSNGSPTAFLAYHELLKSNDPRADLLDFLESCYQAGAKLAKWDIEAFRTLSLDEL